MLIIFNCDAAIDDSSVGRERADDEFHPALEAAAHCPIGLADAGPARIGHRAIVDRPVGGFVVLELEGVGIAAGKVEFGETHDLGADQPVADAKRIVFESNDHDVRQDRQEMDGLNLIAGREGTLAADLVPMLQQERASAGTQLRQVRIRIEGPEDVRHSRLSQARDRTIDEMSSPQPRTLTWEGCSVPPDRASDSQIQIWSRRPPEALERPGIDEAAQDIAGYAGDIVVVAVVAERSRPGD